MDTEINDLLDEHEIVTFTDIANQLQVHVNKGNFVKIFTPDKRSFGSKLLKRLFLNHF